MTASQAALKCAEICNDREEGFSDQDMKLIWKRRDAILAFADTLRDETEAGEPVAWWHNDFGVVELSRVQRVGWRPLYAAPLAAQPSREQRAVEPWPDTEADGVVFCGKCGRAR